MNRLQHKKVVWSMVAMILLCVGIVYLPSLSYREYPLMIHQVNTYPYYEATIEDIPPLDEVKAIMIMSHYHPEMAESVVLIGDQTLTEKIIRRKIFLKKVVGNEKWVKQITSHFKNAERVEDLDYGLYSRVAFITNHGAYMVMLEMEDDQKIVYGSGYQSGQLFQDFGELGLFEILRPDSGNTSIPSPLDLKVLEPSEIPQYESEKSDDWSDF